MIDKRGEFLISYMRNKQIKNHMASQILIRKIPGYLKEWIDKERKRNLMTQQEFLIKILENFVKPKQYSLFGKNDNSLAPKSSAAPFTFIDLFAGIGGFRLGLESLGGKCVFSSEWDKHAQKTYGEWFGEIPIGDITRINPKDIPDHDILAAGFPCQPFSIAGVSKKKSLGYQHGFKDQTQGTLFFNLATIAEIKRPPVIFLENVKNLKSHDKGITWQIIKSTLEELEYRIFYKIIDAAYFVPQHRERIIIVGFDTNVFGNSPPFHFPNIEDNDKPKLKNILERKPDSKYILTDHLWNYLRRYAEEHRKKGNGFGYGLADPDGITRTLSARYYKDGSEILIPRGKEKNPRRLTPREAARLMGFPDSLEIVVSDTQAYRQFGNAIVPAVVESIGLQIVKVLCWHIYKLGNGCLVKGR